MEYGCQRGYDGLEEAFTSEEQPRARLDGGCEEDGQQRDDVEVVPAPEAAHIL